MKKLMVILFMLTLPVFSGNEPTDERESNMMIKWEESQGFPWNLIRLFPPRTKDTVEYHTQKEFQALPWNHKRKLTSTLSIFSGVGVTMASIAAAAGGDIGSVLSAGGMLSGLGLVGTGCYLAFWSPKDPEE